jgi:hypothetical protein
MLFIIDKLADPDETEIFWLSEVSDLDNKVKEVLSKYKKTYFFDEKDLESGVVDALNNYLRTKKKKEIESGRRLHWEEFG